MYSQIEWHIYYQRAQCYVFAGGLRQKHFVILHKTTSEHKRTQNGCIWQSAVRAVLPLSSGYCD